MVLIKKTLADKLRDFSRVRIKKISVKVPRLKVRNAKVTKSRKDDSLPVSSIINILIKSAVEKAKRERKKKIEAEEDKSYTILKEQRDLSINSGYGTVSKGYGTTPRTSYVDYGKLFSYLGSFRAKQPYENMAEHLGNLNKATESGSFTLADKQTIERGTGYIKYFLGGLALNPESGVHPSSLVPVAGMTSSEWEQFKMWMRLDSVMYILKSRTS